LNVRCLETVRSYHEDVPAFLRNRPPFLLQHCLKRLPSCTGLCAADVCDNDGTYVVRNTQKGTQHVVQLQSEVDHRVPHCDCVDWRRHCLPCKHLLAVVMFAEGCSGWESLPQFYRSIPQFNLDPKIHPATVTVTSHTDVEPESVPESPATITLYPGVEPNSFESVAREPNESLTQVTALQSKVRQTLSLISTLTYTTDDRDFLTEHLYQLQQQLNDFRNQSSSHRRHATFRFNRRTTKHSIAASKLKRRLAAVRARRLAKRKSRQKKGTKMPGANAFRSSTSNSLAVPITVAEAKLCNLVLASFGCSVT